MCATQSQVLLYWEWTCFDYAISLSGMSGQMKSILFTFRWN